MPSRILSKARLGVIAVKIRNPANNRKTKVCALQDTGANAMILRKSVATKLGLNGERTQQTISGFNTQRRVEVEHVNLSIRGVSSETEKRTYDVSNVLVMSDEHMPSIST